MDRIYVKHHNKAPVHQLGLDLWRDHVIRRPQIRDRLLVIVLDNIHRERTGEVIDRALMRAITQVLLTPRRLHAACSDLASDLPDQWLLISTAG